MCLKHVENGFTSINNETEFFWVFFPAPPKKGPFAPPPPGWCLPAATVRRRVWARVVLQKQLSLGDVDASWKTDQRKKCRLNNFCTDFFGDFTQVFFLRFWGNLAHFLFAVFRQFGTLFFFRFLGDLAHLGWLRAIMLKLKNKEKTV